MMNLLKQAQSYVKGAFGGSPQLELLQDHDGPL